MNSITKVTVLTMKKGSKIIEIESERVEVCTDPNCNCIGSWGRVENEKGVNNALMEGFKIIGENKVYY